MTEGTTPLDRPVTPSGRGFGAVGAALVISGLLVNGFLAIVARYVPPAEYTYFSAFWSLALVVGFGVYLPVEQILARSLSGDPDHAGAFRAMLTPTAVLLGLELVVTAALSPVLWVVTGRDPVVLAAVGALCVVSAGQFLLRGWNIGTGRMGVYAVVLLTDAALRVALAIVVGALGDRGNGGFAWALVAAIAVAHLPLLARVLTRERPDATTGRGPAPERERGIRPVLTLALGALAGQVMLNGIPVVVAGVATASEQVPAGRFQAAFQLVRIPLFLATPLQATILPTLVSTIDRGGHAAVITLLRRTVAALLALVVVGAAIGYVAGPLLVELVFGARYRVGRADVAVLAVGVACYLVALVVTQLLVALHRSTQVTLAWAASVATAAITFLAVDGLFAAAEWSFVVGSATAVAVGLTAASRRAEHPAGSAPVRRPDEAR